MVGSVGDTVRLAIAMPSRIRASALSYSACARRSSPNAIKLDATAGCVGP